MIMGNKQDNKKGEGADFAWESDALQKLHSRPKATA